MVDRIIDGKVSLGELNGTVLRAGYTGAVVMDYALPNVPLIETAHAPTIRKLLDTDSLTLSKSAVRMLSRPLLLPAHSPALLESWQVLAEGLKPEDEVVITQRQLKAYLIGDALLQHTALPYGERLRAVGVALDAQVMVEGKLVEVETYLIDEYGDPVKVHKDKKVPQLFLKGALNATRKRIEQAVSHQPKNLEEAQ
ncbi:MAG TPA: hypothetical protein VLH77_03105, partial [Gammaproteobacteria bacterium]|nr:hypothetical protein [Gammaproteobacteria bacterium]